MVKLMNAKQNRSYFLPQAVGNCYARADFAKVDGHFCQHRSWLSHPFSPFLICLIPPTTFQILCLENYIDKRYIVCYYIGMRYSD
jgi:hypothetical protein